MFSLASVKEKNGVITVSYVHRESIQADIKRVFKTSRVNTYMFLETGRFSFSLYSFFALELYHIIDIILNNKNRSSTSRRTFKVIREELLKNTWLRNLEVNHPSRLDFSMLKKFHYAPLDYQSKFMERYNQTLPRYNLNGMMLAADPGTGKTFTSLAIAECLHSDYIIVICPKPAVERVWVTSVANPKNMDGLYNKPETCWYKASGKPYTGERVLVFHYEAIPTAFDIIKLFKGKKVTVILDESHNLNEIKSLRTLRFIDLCKELNSQDIIFATGTPIKALSVETIPLFKAIDPLFNDNVLEAFKKMYAGEVQATTEILSRRYNIVSYKVSKKIMNLSEPIHESIDITVPNGDEYTLETIASEMSLFSFNRVKELEKELPDAQEFYYKTLKLCKEKLLHSKDRSAIPNFSKYEDCVKSVIKAYKNGTLYYVGEEMKYCTQYEKNIIIPMIGNKVDKEKFIHSKTLVKYLKLKVRGECLGRILGRKRINAFRDLVKYINFEPFIETTEKKTVIFTTYKEVIEEVLDKLREQQYEPVAVYGQFTKDLASIVHRFEKVEELNPLVATYASLSTAVPLIMADTMVVINPPFRQYIMDQTIARIHRLGATTQTRIFNINLVTGTKPNICSRTIDIMQWSKEQVGAILGVTGGDDADETDNVSMEQCAISLEHGDYEVNLTPSVLNNW